jgi:flagellar hook-associated protein 3 FlgL
MLRRVDSETERFLNDLARINERLARAQREVSSGRRLNQPSDDPDQVSQLLMLRSQLAATEQIRANLGRVTAEVNTAEQTLSAAVERLERAAVLGSQGAGSTASAEQRLLIAREVEALITQMVNLADTTVEGRYIFSGNADGQIAYTLDWTQSYPVSAYLGSAATRTVAGPGGQRIAVAKTAAEIFDNPDPAKNVFQALNNLRAGLLANDEAAIQASLAQIRTASVHLNDQLAFYGMVQNQVAAATEASRREELRLKTRISEIQDADLTESILAMNQARFQQEVALNAKGKMPRTSLFDYLG